MKSALCHLFKWLTRVGVMLVYREGDQWRVRVGYLYCDGSFQQVSSGTARPGQMLEVPKGFVVRLMQ